MWSVPGAVATGLTIPQLRAHVTCDPVATALGTDLFKPSVPVLTDLD